MAESPPDSAAKTRQRKVVGRPFQPGTGGRPPGTPNKFTLAFREAIQYAYQGIGGHERFRQWADENPTDFYKIAARLIPVELVMPASQVVVIQRRTDQPASAVLVSGADNPAELAKPYLEHKPDAQD